MNILLISIWIVLGVFGGYFLCCTYGERYKYEARDIFGLVCMMVIIFMFINGPFFLILTMLYFKPKYWSLKFVLYE